ncbi:hypothetical protein [Methylobacterium sp. ID0610]|uniref:hypothetical protein n=1 Tax=Methylobacterium carpenticola TaxID=3344827 RepID=UPI00369DDD3B
MRTKPMMLAGAMMVALGGAAVAQTTAPGSAERNMNNPGSVKSNAEKGMPERDAVAPTGAGPAATGTVTGTGAGTMPGGDPRTAPKPTDPTPGR